MSWIDPQHQRRKEMKKNLLILLCAVFAIFAAGDSFAKTK